MGPTGMGPCCDIRGYQFGHSTLVAAQTLVCEQITPLAVEASVEEVLVIEPNAVAHVGHQCISPFLHLIERGRDRVLLDPFAGHVDPERIGEAAKLTG